MSGGSHIVAVGTEELRPEPSSTIEHERDDVLALEEAWEEVEEPAKRKTGWILPSLAGLAVAVWTGFFVFAHWSEASAGSTPQQWSEWITSWAVPVLLVLAVCLLIMRSSTREAARFGNVASDLSRESALLEQRLITVNRELSLARDFVAAQSRDLESLGRIASERLSTHASELQSLIQDNSAQVEQIATVGTNALENMNKLRGELPVIANFARDVTSQIGNAGRTAHTQLGDLIGGFYRLNEFGEASERQVTALREKVDAALSAFEEQAKQMEQITTSRFEALGQQSEAFRSELDGQEIAALAAIHSRADALRKELAQSWEDFDAKEAGALEAMRVQLGTLREQAEAFSSTMRTSESAAQARWDAAIQALRDKLTDVVEEIASIEESSSERVQERLRFLAEETRKIDAEISERAEAGIALTSSRLAELDAAVAARHDQHLASLTDFTRRSEELVAQLGDLGGQMEAISAQGGRAGREMAEASDAVSRKILANKEAIEATNGAIAELTNASVRLLELIRAGEEHSRDQLPSAIESAETRLEAFEERAVALGELLGEAGKKGQALSDYVLAARQDGQAVYTEFDNLHQRFTEQGSAYSEQIDRLRTGLAVLAEESESLSGQVQNELAESVTRLQSALRNALDELSSGQSGTLQKFAEDIGGQSADAIERAIRDRTADAVGELEQAASQASEVSREAARQLRDQLAMVSELTDNLEARVTRARERAEEQVDNDFSRRVALITESLNSNAIDISKALSNDVTDTAWASYLRGDRGIFTRRAVRLLDNSEAKEIAEIYNRDSDFREHVSRYIHDFEAMLRTMLSTRDGKALGVTLLSSDMGKLYVVLAQAIERLRN